MNAPAVAEELAASLRLRIDEHRLELQFRDSRVRRTDVRQGPLWPDEVDAQHGE